MDLFNNTRHQVGTKSFFFSKREEHVFFARYLSYLLTFAGQYERKMAIYRYMEGHYLTVGLRFIRNDHTKHLILVFI